MKRMNVIWVGSLVVAVTTVLFCNVLRDQSAVLTFAADFSGAPVVVIDAGHGGEDGGAVSLTGAYESNINLAIAKRLDAALCLVGYPTHMLRDTDISLHDRDAVTIRQKKVSDLRNRVSTICAQENPVLISIHQNSYPGSQYSGAQVFFTSVNESRALAEHIQQALIQNVDPGNGRQVKQVPDSIYLFNHISCPAVLIECGFLTNPREEALLQQPDYQTKLAITVAASYLKYLSQ